MDLTKLKVRNVHQLDHIDRGRNDLGIRRQNLAHDFSRMRIHKANNFKIQVIQFVVMSRP